MKIIILIFLFFVPIVIPLKAQAACSTPCISPQVCKEDPPRSGNFACFGPSSGSGYTSTGSTVQTALGPIPTDPKELVKWILGWSIAMGGGIAFLLSLWGGVTIILAGGNPEKINEGKEIITSAVSGLLFILFSVFLLRFIGVDVLGIFQ